jgi:hypothetical protein
VAEQALRIARIELLKQGVAPEQIELLLRGGIPADEIVKVAKERDTECLVIGRRGNSLKQKLHRFFMGSTSRGVLKLSRCPVLIASLSPIPAPHDLIHWYKEAIAAHLHEHPGRLVSFTTAEQESFQAGSASASSRGIFQIPLLLLSIP